MPNLDYEAARKLLDDKFTRMEALYLSGQARPEPPAGTRRPIQALFESHTQAYREALLGCALTRILDRSIDIRLPYVNQGPKAFNARELDTVVVNDFLHARQIPSTKGPYLSVFRRQVKFMPRTGSGLRDKTGYTAFLACIRYLESTDNEGELVGFLESLLLKFIELREAANVPLSRLQRISLEQYGKLIDGLLGTKSGGLFPVLLVVATFETISRVFALEWIVASQGINVADAASGAGGDITIRKDGETLLAVEVTERQVDRARVVQTFNTKIAPRGIQDYLFLVKEGAALDQAKEQAERYFAQGHEVNFVVVKEWILNCLATMGREGRTTFNDVLMATLEAGGVPKALRVAWNDQVNALLGA